MKRARVRRPAKIMTLAIDRRKGTRLIKTGSSYVVHAVVEDHIFNFSVPTVRIGRTIVQALKHEFDEL